MNKQKTGIFSGSFNPIHIGHLALANYLCEYGGLDEIWFLVSPQNPFKQNVELLDDKIRLEMVKAAVSGYPRFCASDFEFTLPRPSYTVDTLNRLAEAYPDREFTLIIGADNWAKFVRIHKPTGNFPNTIGNILDINSYFVCSMEPNSNISSRMRDCNMKTSVGQKWLS